jgi:response regulator of citrate/malate metabolism
MNKKISVMIIDDNRIDLFIHHEFVKQMNIAHTVQEFAFASEAVKFLEENDASKWPQLILLDIHMPIMNGFDFLKKYSSLPDTLKKNCTIIIVSSSLDVGDKSKIKECPQVLELMEKPLNAAKLLSLLKNNTII